MVFDKHGRENSAKPRHARDVIREVHRALVKEGVRDQVTLIASGGVALPEHMAKAIICGADLVAIDIPLLLAMECRLCGQCEQGEICPILLEQADADYAVHRVKNLMAPGTSNWSKSWARWAFARSAVFAGKPAGRCSSRTSSAICSGNYLANEKIPRGPINDDYYVTKQPDGRRTSD